MGNENERKRDPAENRENRQGHQWDDVKSGGDERNVGLTGDQGFGDGGGARGSSAGTTGVVGGSPAFLSGEESAAGGGQQTGYGSQGGPAGSTDPGIGNESSQVLTGDQGGDNNFGGRTGSGTSVIAANNSRADLGASGAGSPGNKSESGEKKDRPAIGPGGQSEIGGASDLGGGETGLGSRRDEESDDYLERDGNPEGGFAERGRGAPEGSEPGSTTR